MTELQAAKPIRHEPPVGKRAGYKHAALLVAMFVLLPSLYFASYFALLSPKDHRSIHGPRPVLWRHPQFRISHPWVEAVYWPLVELDQRLRPSYWNPYGSRDS